MSKAVTVEALKSYVRKEAPHFLEKPNVTSVGIGYKQVAGKATRELCIQFTVGRKAAPEAPICGSVPSAGRFSATATRNTGR